ncbi:dicarboxylate/amino acid:cation symporter [Novosphingobium sp.]|uniref:dicarboxylate/amino acid:cation symporter n=1 Tax=Novosphingobium sp. TaxID=1874826 RepID=UPI0035B02801
MTAETTTAGRASSFIPDVRVPVGWTLGGLGAGLALGIALEGTALAERLLPFADVIGTLWLRGLQMTIVPLVAALLVIGIVQTVAAASAGRVAGTSLALFAAILTAGTVFTAFTMPALLDAFPIPPAAAEALRQGLSAEQAGEVPTIADFLKSLIPSNIFAAAAETAMIAIIVFFSLLALAIVRLPATHRQLMVTFFEAITGTMLVIIGWVLWLAPVGVFALSLSVAGQSGLAALGALAHYIVTVASMGGVVLLLAYGVAVFAARQQFSRFFRAALPVQAMAISTQSSLASLPAMLAACRTLGLKETTGEFVLPLAVALFRATGPAMNLAVAIYVARLTGVELSPVVLATGVLVALATTIGSVSLPGAISFVTAIGPIAIAMGVPIGPLALLVAVEVLPDIMRTVGNVTMDVAVAATVDRHTAEEGEGEAGNPASTGSA